MSSLRRIRVLISYAHEPSIVGHKERALEFAQSLRVRGVEAQIDQFVENDGVHWPRWMLDQVRAADFVVCLGSPTYKERAEGRGTPASGRGSRWEGAIVTESLYTEFSSMDSKFIAAVFDDCVPDDIPDMLQPVGRTHYILPRDDEDLYRRLTGQPRVVPAPIGPIMVLGTSS